MATGNAELSNRRRRTDFSAAKSVPVRKGSARPVYQPYEPPRREERRAAPSPRNGADYHPDVQLKTLTSAEIRAICLVILIVTAVAMGIILLSAEATVTQKEINDLKKSMTQTDDDIANLKVEIEQSQNMQLIKTRAQEELGMQDPSFDQYVYVSDLAVAQPDFGDYIKERAYGGARTEPAVSDAETGSEE